MPNPCTCWGLLKDGEIEHNHLEMGHAEHTRPKPVFPAQNWWRGPRLEWIRRHYWLTDSAPPVVCKTFEQAEGTSMIFASAAELKSEIDRRIEGRLSRFLPEDHHGCVSGLMEMARLAEFRNFDSLVAGEEYPEDILEMMATTAAQNIAAQHMVGTEKEKAAKAKAKDAPVRDKTVSFGLVRFRRIEYSRYSDWIVYFGRRNDACVMLTLGIRKGV